MANSAVGDARDFNTQIIEEFRANQGRVVRAFLEGAPVILLHHVGAKSGIERVTPVACSPQGGGRFVVCRQRRIARPPGLVSQPQGPPRDHRRGR